MSLLREDLDFFSFPYFPKLLSVSAFIPKKKWQHLLQTTAAHATMSRILSDDRNTMTAIYFYVLTQQTVKHKYQNYE